MRQSLFPLVVLAAACSIPLKAELVYGHGATIRNFPAKICWDLNKAWQRNTPERQRISLCAYWLFRPVGTPASEGECYLQIPGSWRGANATASVRNLQGKPVEKIAGKKIEDYETVVISRTFSAPSAWKGKSIRLKCDYLHAETEILLNGKKIGSCGAAQDYIADCDLAPALLFDRENRLELRMHSTAKKGQIRGGVLEGIYLDVRPEKNFGTPEIETLVSRKTTSLRFRDPAPGLEGTLKLTFRDASDGRVVKQETLPFRKEISFPWIGPKLWSPDSPSLYFLELSLLQDGKTADTEKIRFGFREFTVKGKDYLLNGKPIRFICCSNNHPADWECGFFTSPDHYRNRLLALKRMRYVASYVHRSEQSVLYDVADEVGFLLLPAVHIIPYRDQERFSDQEALDDLRSKLQAAVRSDRYRNHPSVIGFLTDVWFNLHPGSHNPEYIGISSREKSHPTFDADGKVVPGTGRDPNLVGMRLARQKRLEKINNLYHEFFPGKFCMTGGSGEVGNVYSTHLYHTWGAPVHELRALCQRYSLSPQVPIFIGEMNVPYPLSLFYPIMTPNVKRPMFYENGVRFFGNQAYYHPVQIGNMHSMLYEVYENNGKGRIYSFVSSLYDRILTRIMRTTMSAWRCQGLNGVGPFGYVIGGGFLMAGVSRVDRLQEIPDNFTLPWIVPEFLARGANQPPYSHTGSPDLRPASSAAEFLAAWNAVAIDFFGSGKDLWEMDHAFYAGEEVAKSVAVMNDSEYPVSGKLEISLRDGAGNRNVVFSTDVKTPPFSNTRVPFSFQMPGTAARADLILTAELIPEGKTAKRIVRSMDLQVFPQTPAPFLQRPLLVFDPEGLAAKQIDAWGLSCSKVTDLQKIPDNALLVIGRSGLSRTGNVPEWNDLTARNIRILLLEQDQSASLELMKARERFAFIHAGAHPVLAGFRDCDFAAWRGSHSLQKAYQLNSVGQSWSDWGNRNMVAGTVFRRPTQGNYRALLVSGFDFYQTPLLEYSGAKGAWIGCQLEISERMGSDPVATTLFARLLTYLDSRMESPEESATAFFGGPRGETLLKTLGAGYRKLSALTESDLAGVRTLLIAQPDFNALEKYRFELNSFVYEGGRLIYLQIGKEFSPSWLPFTLKLREEPVRTAVTRNLQAEGLWLAGYGNNDFGYEKVYRIPVFADYPAHWDSFHPGVLLRNAHGCGEFLFCSVTPELFGRDYAAHKTARFLSTLFTSAGVRIKTAGGAYMVQEKMRARSIDLVPLAWEFALDPENKGLKEGWHKGNNGSGTWMTGQTADAREVRLGIPWEHFLGKAYDGVGWYRLEVEVPFLIRKSRRAYLNVGAIDDLDEAYINGVKIGSTGEDTPEYWMAPRMYSFDTSILKKGKNWIVFRVTDLREGGGITKLPCTLSNRPGLGGRAWKAPFLDKDERDYLYNPDVVRGY